MLHHPAAIENRPKSSQDSKSQEGADVEGIENWRDEVPEEIEIRIAEIPNCGERLSFPRNVGEP